MSVLMRGVDMPKNCEECNFKGECRNYWEKIREAYTRPSWCPLVEVEPMKTTDYCAICKQDMCKDCIADATNPYCVPSHYEMKQTEPQTDGYMTAEQTEDYRKMLDKAEHKVYGNIEDEPQTDCRRCRHYATDKCKECFGHELFTDSGYATDCSWQKGE